MKLTYENCDKLRLNICKGVCMNKNIIKALNEEGFETLSIEGAKGKSRLVICRCPNGHRNEILWGHWKDGQRCNQCVSEPIVEEVEFEEEELFPDMEEGDE